MTLAPEAPANTAGAAYYEALEHISRAHKDFATFLRRRVCQANENASRHESRTGRIAHHERSAAAEAEYILQQFERCLV